MILKHAHIRHGVAPLVFECASMHVAHSNSSRDTRLQLLKMLVGAERAWVAMARRGCRHGWWTQRSVWNSSLTSRSDGPEGVAATDGGHKKARFSGGLYSYNTLLLLLILVAMGGLEPPTL